MMPHQISMEYRNSRSVTDGHDEEEIIEVRDLVVRFGNVTAVDGISFSVRRGEIFGFWGLTELERQPRYARSPRSRG